MKFVDRNKEQKRLEKAFGSETSKFVVIYGRRRLGKSTLLKRVINENDIYFEQDVRKLKSRYHFLQGQ